MPGRTTYFWPMTSGRAIDFSNRLRLGLRLSPLRAARLFSRLSPSVVTTVVPDRLFQLLDLLLVSDLYEAVTNLCTPGIRGLHPQERQLLQSVFGDGLPYKLIRIDERAHLGPRRYRFCYVSFHTINNWGPLTPALLVHEAVHVWQYVHRGGCYIPRALAAQRTELSYNYGGLAGLRAASTLDDFNYEQMADVIEDAFRLQRGLPMKWAVGDRRQLSAEFGRFLAQLRVPLPEGYFSGW